LFPLQQATACMTPDRLHAVPCVPASQYCPIASKLDLDKCQLRR
jgi:hypothetical protein